MAGAPGTLGPRTARPHQYRYRGSVIPSPWPLAAA